MVPPSPPVPPYGTNALSNMDVEGRAVGREDRAYSLQCQCGKEKHTNGDGNAIFNLLSDFLFLANSKEKKRKTMKTALPVSF